MSKLRQSINIKTAFRRYVIDEQIGEGGAGRVYGGHDEDDGTPIAVKILTQTSNDKKRRFKNETAFLTTNKHPNIVTVTDYGLIENPALAGPFYVMRRYDGNLRRLTNGKLKLDAILPLFSQILDGVEAAHLQRVTHRDLKPENILLDEAKNLLAIADFGVASFTDDFLLTLVETSPTQRLANFVYAAPEQRSSGNEVSRSADIYALGLMLNEMFTGSVPLGTDFRSIGSVAEQYGYLDGVVTQMIKQNPTDRPATIEHVKSLIQKFRADAVSLQKISKLNATVIPASEVDDPLAFDPPILVDANWENGVVRLTLDRPVNQGWIEAFRESATSYPLGAGPMNYQFNGNVAMVRIHANDAQRETQRVIDNFKPWLINATRKLKEKLTEKLRQEEQKRRQRLAEERAQEELRLSVNRNLRI